MNELITFPCPYCDSAQYDCEQFNRHINICDKRPKPSFASFRCGHCDGVFSNAETLHEHVVTWHSPRPSTQDKIIELSNIVGTLVAWLPELGSHNQCRLLDRLHELGVHK